MVKALAATFLFAVLALCISVSFLMLGARLAKIHDRTFGKALTSTLLGGAAAIALVFLASPIPLAGPLLGFILSYAARVLLSWSIFETTLKKAAVAEGVHAGATIVISVVFLLVMVLVFSQGSAAAPFIYTLF